MIDKLDLNFRPLTPLPAESLNKMVGKTNEIIEHLEEGGASVMGDGSVSETTIGGLTTGTDVSGMSVTDVIGMIIAPEYAPVWHDATAIIGYAGSAVQEVGSFTPSRGEFTASGSAAMAVGKTTAYGGQPADTISGDFGVEVTTPSSKTFTLSRAYAKGSVKVVSSKGSETRKTASSANTLLSLAQVNQNVGSDFLIIGLTRTASKTISYVYPVYGSTADIGTLSKQPLSVGKSIELDMPSENTESKHSFALASSYTVTKVEIFNTISGKYETYQGRWNQSSVTYTLGSASVRYTRYTRNDGTNGATKFKITYE